MDRPNKLVRNQKDKPTQNIDERSPRSNTSAITVAKHLDSLTLSQNNEIIQEDLEFENEETKTVGKEHKNIISSLRNKASSSKETYQNKRYSLNRNPKKQQY